MSSPSSKIREHRECVLSCLEEWQGQLNGTNQIFTWRRKKKPNFFSVNNNVFLFFHELIMFFRFRKNFHVVALFRPFFLPLQRRKPFLPSPNFFDRGIINETFLRSLFMIFFWAQFHNCLPRRVGYQCASNMHQHTLGSPRVDSRVYISVSINAKLDNWNFSSKVRGGTAIYRNFRGYKVHVCRNVTEISMSIPVITV